MGRFYLSTIWTYMHPTFDVARGLTAQPLAFCKWCWMGAEVKLSLWYWQRATSPFLGFGGRKQAPPDHLHLDSLIRNHVHIKCILICMFHVLVYSRFFQFGDLKECNCTPSSHLRFLLWSPVSMNRHSQSNPRMQWGIDGSHLCD